MSCKVTIEIDDKNNLKGKMEGKVEINHMPLIRYHLAHIYQQYLADVRKAELAAKPAVDVKANEAAKAKAEELRKKAEAESKAADLKRDQEGKERRLREEAMKKAQLQEEAHKMEMLNKQVNNMQKPKIEPGAKYIGPKPAQDVAQAKDVA